MNQLSLSKHRKQVLLLYTSTFIGIFLGVLCSIVNTRFLSPEDYGDVRYVQNLVQFLSSVLMLGYFLSGSRLLALTDDEEKRREVRGGMIFILIITSLVLFGSIGVCALVHLSKPHIAWLFVICLPVSINLLLSNYINNTAQGDNHIGRISASNTIPYLLYVPVAYFIYKYWGATSEKMILLQWGIYTVILLLIVISTHPSFKNIRKSLVELNNENKQYGIQLYYGSLFMIASTYLAGIFLGMFNEDNVNVGFYTLALTVTTPIMKLPGIIGTTYFREFARMDCIPKKVMSITVFMTVLSVIIFIALIKPVVTFLYTEQYSKVGTYAIWLSLGFGVHGIGDMINRYLGSHGLGKEIRNGSVVCGLIKIVGFTGLVYLWNVEGAIITNILASSAYFIILLFYYLHFIKENGFNEKVNT